MAGAQQPFTLDDVSLVLMNQIGNVGINVTDGNDNPADATVLNLNIMDLGGNTCWYDTSTPSTTTIAAGSDGIALPTAIINVASTTGYAARGPITVTTTAGPQQVYYSGITPTSFTGCSRGIGTMVLGNTVTNAPVGGSLIQNPYTGFYYYPFGSLPNQTYGLNEYIFSWSIQVAGNNPPKQVLQDVQTVSLMAMSHVPYMRLMIDKARKFINPATDVFLGYTDAHLLAYLQGGCQWINAAQPEVVPGFSPDNFPREFRQVMLDAALIVGVMSQNVYAIDTDIPSYSDQGTSFQISHAPALSQYINQLTQILATQIPAMKLQFVRSGSLHIEAGPSFRLATLLQAAPYGSLFRGTYSASPS